MGCGAEAAYASFMRSFTYLALLFGLGTSTADEVVVTSSETDALPVSFMVLMIETITPASDIVWGIEDPQTDAEWQAIDDAAVTLVESFETMREGGAGPNDDGWAAEAMFDAYIDEEIVALEKIRAAIAARDVDGVIDAGGDLYTPCEECHIDYNPGVQ